MIPLANLIKTIEDGTPPEIPSEKVQRFHLDALQYWWLHHEDARHQADQAHIADEIALLKRMAIVEPKGPYFARLLGCMVIESQRHSKAQADYRKRIGKIIETWEAFPIAKLFQELRWIAGQWLLIPNPQGTSREGNDVPTS